MTPCDLSLMKFMRLPILTIGFLQRLALEPSWIGACSYSAQDRRPDLLND